MQGGQAAQREVAVNTLIDPGWKGLYMIGGLSCLAVGILWIIGLAYLVILGAAPSEGDAFFSFVAGRKLLLQTTIGVFALSDFFLIPAVLALYAALRGISRSTLPIALGLFGLFIALDLGVNLVSLSVLVPLTDKYMAAATDAQRAGYIAAADLARAATVVGISLANLAYSIGAIIIGLVMLRGIFGKARAYLGLASGIADFVGTIAVPGLGITFLISLIIAAVWFLALSSKLYGLGGGVSPVPR